MSVTNWTNVTDFQGILMAGNDATSYFWTGMYFMVLFIIWASLVVFQGWQVAMLATGFIGILIGLMLTYLGLMAVTWLLLVVGLMVLMMFWIYYINNKEV